MLQRPVFFALGVLALAAATGCNRTKIETVKGDSSNEPTPVSVAKAVREDLSRTLVLTGELVPFQEVEVMAKVAGYVQRIHVDVGDFVRQGQPIADLEVPEMKDDLTRAAASIQRYRADLTRAQDEVRRAETAHQMAHLTHTRLANVEKTRPGLVAQQEIDDALSKDQIAESQVAVAKSQLSAAHEQIKVVEAEQNKFRTLSGYTRVVAPFDGVVTKRYADTGAMIQAGVASQTQAMPVVRLSQHNLLRLVLPVPESAAGGIKTGSTVQVRVPSLGRNFAGKVARTSDQVETATRTMRAEVDVPNPSRTLIPGMYAEIVLTVAQSHAAISIPLTAITKKEYKSSAWVVNGKDQLEMREIETGITSPTRIEVKSGIVEGEMVVLGARGTLRQGMHVQPKLVDAPAKNGGA